MIQDWPQDMEVNSFSYIENMPICSNYVWKWLLARI
jgi:hypothetical protein